MITRSVYPSIDDSRVDIADAYSGYQQTLEICVIDSWNVDSSDLLSWNIDVVNWTKCRLELLEEIDDPFDGILTLIIASWLIHESIEAMEAWDDGFRWAAGRRDFEHLCGIGRVVTLLTAYLRHYCASRLFSLELCRLLLFSLKAIFYFLSKINVIDIYFNLI